MIKTPLIDDQDQLKATVNFMQLVPNNQQHKMSAEMFCYWLQGHFELNPDLKELDEKQIQIIKEHLKLVFNQITPFQYPGLDSQLYC